MGDKQPRTINLQEIMEKAATDPFWTARGLAVQAYANLEQAVCDVFSILAGVPRDVGAMIFFRINSAHAVSTILEKLFKRAFGNRFNLFRNSLVADLKQIAGDRNEVVHWTASNHISPNEDGTHDYKITMRPAHSWIFDSGAQQMDIADLEEFQKRCSFYTRLVRMFYMMACQPPRLGDAPPTSDAEQTWLDIFSQPITYPPPVAHPLSQKPQERPIPPGSSVVIVE